MTLSVRLTFVVLIVALLAGVLQLRSRNAALEQQLQSAGSAP